MPLSRWRSTQLCSASSLARAASASMIVYVSIASSVDVAIRQNSTSSTIDSVFDVSAWAMLVAPAATNAHGCISTPSSAAPPKLMRSSRFIQEGSGPLDVGRFGVALLPEAEADQADAEHDLRHEGGGGRRRAGLQGFAAGQRQGEHRS